MAAAPASVLLPAALHLLSAPSRRPDLRFRALQCSCRDRRQPLFGPPAASSQDHSHVDLEALEAENDRGIAALSERVGALRGITSGIHGEVESQHRLLDSMAMSMGGVQLSLRATADKMAKVMNEPQKRRMVLMAGGAAVLLFLLYLWLRR